jgi:septal ring factor EnvC (AmiA/AmiB activator)
MPSTGRFRLPVLALALPLAAALALWAASPLSSQAASQGDLQNKIDGAQSREQSLSADAATFGRIADRLAEQVSLLQRRQAAVQAQLDRERARLARTRASLKRERARLARLKRRLARSKHILALRLLDRYKTGSPDLVTVIFSARGFADLVETGEYLQRIGQQDEKIIIGVRQARNASRRAAARLARLQAAQARSAAAVQAQRDALASMGAQVAAKQASFERARQARLEALQATKANRRKLQKQLEKLQAEESRSSGGQAGPGPFGQWAIPWPIVQCESGGQNLPPNWAGASGYYQIIPSTWSGFGGNGPAAYLQPKSEQDRVARLIWAGGDGARNWDCWKILNGIPLG